MGVTGLTGLRTKRVELHFRRGQPVLAKRAACFEDVFSGPGGFTCLAVNAIRLRRAKLLSIVGRSSGGFCAFCNFI